MAEERVRLEVEERSRLGSAASRRLRREGYIPGIIYGRGRDPHPVAIRERELRRAVSGAHGLHTILDVVVDGRTAPSMIKDYQQDPVRGWVSHVDLQEVRLDRPIQTQVVVELVGESPGVKEGGVLSQVTREINVEALPLEVPDRLELDVGGMAIGDTLRLADLPAREGVTYLDDPEETVLATVTMPTRVEEPEELLEAEEGMEVPPGEEMPEGAAEGPAEPDADAAGSPGTAEG